MCLVKFFQSLWNIKNGVTAISSKNIKRDGRTYFFDQNQSIFLHASYHCPASVKWQARRVLIALVYKILFDILNFLSKHLVDLNKTDRKESLKPTTYKNSISLQYDSKLKFRQLIKSKIFQRNSSTPPVQNLIDLFRNNSFHFQVYT